MRDVLSWSRSGLRVSFSGLNASFISADFAGNEMNSRDAKADLPLNLTLSSSNFQINTPEEDVNAPSLLFPHI